MALLPSPLHVAGALAGAAMLAAPGARALEPEDLAGLWITDGEDGTTMPCPAPPPLSGPRCVGGAPVYESLAIDAAGGFSFGYESLELDLAAPVSAGRVEADGEGGLDFDFIVDRTFGDSAVAWPQGGTPVPWLSATQRRTVLVSGDRLAASDAATGEVRFYTRYDPATVDALRDVLATAEIAARPAWRAVASCIAGTLSAVGPLPAQQAALLDYLAFAHETRDWDGRTEAALADLAAGHAEQSARAAALAAAKAGERDRLRADYDRFMQALSDRESAAALTFQEWSATVLFDEGYQRRDWIAQIRAAGVEPLAALACQIDWDTLDALMDGR